MKDKNKYEDKGGDEIDVRCAGRYASRIGFSVT
jgi:hypothetical protein